MNKIISIDYIRALSVIGILLCHCCYGIQGIENLGRFLGNTFNVVFLTISAFLIGLSFENKGNKQYDKKFLIHRVGKLAYSYYPFILLMFAFLIYTGYNVSIKNVASHFLFLAWFDKLSGFGHLWYITLIVMCYFAIYFVSKLPSRMLNYIKSGGFLLILAIVSQIALERIGQPNYIFIYILLYVYIFLNARKILEIIDKLPLKPTIIIGSAIVILVMLLFWYDATNIYTSKWCGLASAITVFAITKKIFNKADKNLIVNFISTISFEIYLTHHVFCFGKHSIYHIIPNPILGTIVIFIISFILAKLLKTISNCVNNIFSKKQS